ncbi:hypothetical protein RhiirA1_454365 [Rhizophagus irregularis]|uniref:Uncharacterized protein n=1 Tax=Rhizophagus irregularis TaxID=588596 RepID=A0A2N0S5E5_9GLOM|nr:hypothetical protein RhiirA1_454365 [Rhizophagus irregularis]GET61020.1 hypothetical protein RIR_e53646_A0A2N0S5E5_9GLOM [Rhizophagus irregularis DAOM 181602=DAOM 197198]GET61034.1 hypothetical protein RIR_e53645_A0A2N0S5E5_9GLOM [Rhizophagus irregularis DAOM 181602=DAOM 197198]
MLWCTTADRQERDWEGRKSQENTRKKQSKGSRKAGLQEWHNIGTSCLTGNQKVSEWIATHL